MLRQTSNEEQTLDCTAEMAASTAEEGLRYVSDSAPGYTRKRTGTTFGYYDKDGERITDAAVIQRIKSIGIPPAYESVDPRPMAISKRPGSVRVAASNTATTRNGASCARKQVRAHHAVRGCAAGVAQPSRHRHEAGRTASRESTCHDRQSSGEDADPGGQHAVCRKQQVLPAHHYAPQTCRRRPRRPPVRLHGQIR